MAKDVFHDVVRHALEKDGWTITQDPFHIRYGIADVYIDLAADRTIAAEKEGQKIAVEIKRFIRGSAISEFHTALGQFLNYRIVLNAEEPDRALYLAVPNNTYQSFFKFEPASIAIAQYSVQLLTYDATREAIVQWIN